MAGQLRQGSMSQSSVIKRALSIFSLSNLISSPLKTQNDTKLKLLKTSRFESEQLSFFLTTRSPWCPRKASDHWMKVLSIAQWEQWELRCVTCQYGQQGKGPGEEWSYGSKKGRGGAKERDGMDYPAPELAYFPSGKNISVHTQTFLRLLHVIWNRCSVPTATRLHSQKQHFSHRMKEFHPSVSLFMLFWLDSVLWFVLISHNNTN